MKLVESLEPFDRSTAMVDLVAYGGPMSGQPVRKEDARKYGYLLVRARRKWYALIAPESAEWWPSGRRHVDHQRSLTHFLRSVEAEQHREDGRVAADLVEEAGFAMVAEDMRAKYYATSAYFVAAGDMDWLEGFPVWDLIEDDAAEPSDDSPHECPDCGCPLTHVVGPDVKATLCGNCDRERLEELMDN